MRHLCPPAWHTAFTNITQTIDRIFIKLSRLCNELDDAVILSTTASRPWDSGNDVWAHMWEDVRTSGPMIGKGNRFCTRKVIRAGSQETHGYSYDEPTDTAKLPQCLKVSDSKRLPEAKVQSRAAGEHGNVINVLGFTISLSPAYPGLKGALNTSSHRGVSHNKSWCKSWKLRDPDTGNNQEGNLRADESRRSRDLVKRRRIVHLMDDWMETRRQDNPQHEF
ncbi:hypothetical protein Bbelb_175870 [Branchiostoma belcheri]|nr:hypothetical protein Bbelb_175870 [Branchiostoma belcheri]